jgi:tetratricopeptide (TPR) repeat protein
LDTKLLPLEAQAELSPREGFSRAKQLLADRDLDATPLRKASILAILSTTSVALSRPEEVRQAITDARAIIDKISTSGRDGAEIARIRNRLLLDEVLLAIRPDEHRAAIPQLDRLITSSPVVSEERACALIARSQKYSDLQEQEKSASDALAAYRIATEGNFVDARIDAAIVLATAYRRSGLFDAGERIVREPVMLAEQRHRPSQLALALYVYGQLLKEMRAYPQARMIALRAREAYRQYDDDFGKALTDLMLCGIEIGSGNTRNAVRYCKANDATFNTAHRQDLVSMNLAYRSQLAIARGDVVGANRLIERAFRLSSGIRSPTEEIEILESRAKIRRAQERGDLAASDLLRVIELTRENSAAERARAITLLSASAEADRLLTTNKMLVAQTERQQIEIQNHQLAQRLRVTVAGIGVALSSLFCYVYWSRARYERAHAAEARIDDLVRTTGILRRANERLASEPDLAVFLSHVLRELCAMAGAVASALYVNRIESPHPVIIASFPDTARPSPMTAQPPPMASDTTNEDLLGEDAVIWQALLKAQDVITLHAASTIRWRKALPAFTCNCKPQAATRIVTKRWPDHV